MGKNWYGSQKLGVASNGSTYVAIRSGDGWEECSAGHSVCPNVATPKQATRFGGELGMISVITQNYGCLKAPSKISSWRTPLFDPTWIATLWTAALTRSHHQCPGVQEVEFQVQEFSFGVEDRLQARNYRPRPAQRLSHTGIILHLGEEKCSGSTSFNGRSVTITGGWQQKKVALLSWHCQDTSSWLKGTNMDQHMIILLFGRRPPQFCGTVRKIHLKTAQDHIEETQILIANCSAIENTGPRQVFLGRGLEEWTHELPGFGDIIRSAVSWSRYNFKVKDNRNETPLHVASTHGRVEVVQCSVPFRKWSWHLQWRELWKRVHSQSATTIWGRDLYTVLWTEEQTNLLKYSVKCKWLFIKRDIWLSIKKTGGSYCKGLRNKREIYTI